MVFIAYQEIQYAAGLSPFPQPSLNITDKPLFQETVTCLPYLNPNQVIGIKVNAAVEVTVGWEVVRV